ncbi:MAG: proprotein convertase P-domain-containing protein, partial [Xanthomonadales bacterium]|nr:proprotein convertase P-domain-containing protein [Xanthomonadales bacterium]
MKKITFLILTFFICAVGLAQPANDLCANAIAITGDGVINGTTVGATTDAAPTCIVNPTSPGVWYTFTDTSGTGSTVDIDICNGTATFDSKMSVYSGSCGALVCVTGNDDSCGLQSAVNFTTDGSSTYYVLVHGYGGATGVFDLTVSGFPASAPGGDISECATGLPLSIDPPLSVTSTVTVTETGVIGAASGDYNLDDVMLNIASGWASDLTITLVSPSSTSLVLTSGNGGMNGLNPAQNLMFTDSSANDVTTWGSSPPLADYQAEGGLFNTVFAGEPVNGVWTLNIVDAVSGDGGSLNSFCLNMSLITVVGNAPTIACPADITINNAVGTCGAVANFAGVAFDDEDGNISGDIIATPASGSTFPVGDTVV